jgi:hypothetical protein
MDIFLLRVHQMQIMHQCHAALNSVNQANTALGKNDQEIFWASIQNLLTAAANIAKACWGQGGKLAVERTDLRESLAVTDDSPLSNTALRNHLEHYDERLDRWYRESTNHNYIDFFIGARVTAIGGADDKDIFRFFDPTTNEVIFWGEHYAIQPLVDEVVRLLPIAQLEARKPHY